MRWLLGLFLLVAAGCRATATPNPDSTVQIAQINVSSDPAPPIVGEAELIVTIKQQDAPLANAPVTVRGDMAHAGMQPVIAEATTDVEGQATIPFRWSMGGDWVVTITVTLPDGSEAQQEFDFTVKS